MTDPIKEKGHKLTNGDGYCYCKHPENHTNLVSATDNIKVRIQELCPDVMELKFGCRVVFQHTPTDFIPSIFIAENRGDKCTLLIGDNITPERMNKTAIKEILGSPITLAVALRAIQKQTKYTSAYMFEAYGKYCPMNAFWNLEHDNYDQQSKVYLSI